MTLDLQQLEPFRAVVEPCSVAEVRPEVLTVVGQTFTFEPMWVIEPEDGSFHHGDWACRPIEPIPGVAWLPSGDLRILP